MKRGAGQRASGIGHPASVGEVLCEMRRLIGSEADEVFALVTMTTSSMAWLEREKPCPSHLRCRLLEAAERRAAGWPQQYAAGHANFRGHWLHVDQRVLIPRPETEMLVDLVIDRLPDARCPLPVIADVGTGSGAIAIALALEARIAGVIALDISPDALNVAMLNAAALGVKERISFRRSDLLLGLLDDRVDVIVSNPPYVATAEWERLDASVRDYEPRLALDGGAGGMDHIRRLVPEARGALEPGGLLALEIDERRSAATLDVLRRAGFESLEAVNDLTGRPRYVLGRQPEKA